MGKMGKKKRNRSGTDSSDWANMRLAEAQSAPSSKPA